MYFVSSTRAGILGLFCSLLFPQHLEKSLTHGRCSLDICSIEINESANRQHESLIGGSSIGEQ